jgi:hypothetical protein
VPKRIVLGSDEWGIIQKALAERLAAVERQKDLAVSTDFAANASRDVERKDRD